MSESRVSDDFTRIGIERWWVDAQPIARSLGNKALSEFIPAPRTSEDVPEAADGSTA